MRKKMVEPRLFGNPNECNSEECRDCQSFSACRELTLKRYSPKGDIKVVEKEARQNSLGSLNFEEGYSPN